MQLPACQAAQATAPPRRILVVDDNKDVARSLVTLLTMEGHEARAAYSGAEAVEVAQEIRPEVVFMDIGMPSMNGHQACRRIREFDWGNGISLIALTGWGQDDDRLRSEQAGFYAHLVKPLEFDDLERVLKHLPSRSRDGSP